jgi:hypothetical protein
LSKTSKPIFFGKRGLSPRSVYHVLRFADRLLDHRCGDHMLDLPALNARHVVAFMEHRHTLDPGSTEWT